MERGYTLQEVTAQVGQHTNDKNVGDGFVSKCLKELRGCERLIPSDRFTIEEITMVGMYSHDLHGHHGRTSITEWIRSHNFEKPRSIPRADLVKAEKKAKAKEPKSVSDERRLERLFEKKLGSVVESTVRKVLEEKVKPVRAEITNGMNRENDDRIISIKKKVDAFVFAEPVSVKEVWTFVQNAFEERNGVQVVRIGGQSLPQWLRHEGYLDVFVEQLQGYLDELHDLVLKQPRLVK